MPRRSKPPLSTAAAVRLRRDSMQLFAPTTDSQGLAPTAERLATRSAFFGERPDSRPAIQLLRKGVDDGGERVVLDR